MPIPDFQTLMVPVLKASASGEIGIGELIDSLSKEFKLTDAERYQLLPSGKDAAFANRTRWARFYLGKAGLVEATKRGHFRITERGRQVLKQNKDHIDISFLSQFDEFNDFLKKGREREGNESTATTVEVIGRAAETPDELLRIIHKTIEQALQKELLDRILNASPAFFEKVIVGLLQNMGYGGGREEAGRAIGKSGDGGLDGVIDQDTLGLDRVYIQAKRYKFDNPISETDIRAFAGSLEGVKATKGVFVTTSYFTDPARKFAEKVTRRIILIDGEKLAELLLRYDVGVRVESTLSIKKIDEDFFGED